MTDKRCRAVEIRQRGNLVGAFPSVRVAARVLGLNEKKVSDVLAKRQYQTGDGYTAAYFNRRAYGARKNR